MSLAAADGAHQRPEELVERMLDEIGIPVDAWAVTATLESWGLRDLDARERFGSADLFGLGARVLAACRARVLTQPLPEPPAEPGPGVARGFVGPYLRGGFFFVPLAMQLVSLLALGYGLWASTAFTAAQASVVALAVILSFIVTGGFGQALGYLAPQFSAAGKDLLARRVSWEVLGLGVLALAMVGAVFALISLTTGFFPSRELPTLLAYYGLVSLLWLTTAALYTLRRYFAMALTTAGGIAVVGIVRAHTSLGVSARQWAGIAAAIAISGTWMALLLRRRARHVRGDLRLARMPSRALLAHSAAPLFIYGLLYFTFLFIDRTAAWSTNAGSLPISLRVPYELGLEWAFISVAAAIALLEYSIKAFSRLLVASQERTPAAAARDHHRDLLRFYARHLAAVLGLVIAGAFAVNAGVLALRDAGAIDEITTALASAPTRGVHIWAIAGYGTLAWGLLNAALLFSLGRPWPVVRAIAVAAPVSVAVAFTLSRTGPYWHSVIGLAVGGAIFAVLTALSTLRTLRQGDYWYYAAY